MHPAATPDPSTVTIENHEPARFIPTSTTRVSRVWHALVGMPIRSSEGKRERISPLEGLPALSLDALTSVAYGPQAIVVILAAGGISALSFTLPITLAIVLLLFLLVVSYRQVIDGFPDGGGAYAVARQEFGEGVSLVAAASLFVDYTLTVAVSIAAGVASLVSAFQQLIPYSTLLCLAFLLGITVINLRGIAESAKAFLLPTAVFVGGLVVIILFGVFHPLAPHISQPGAESVATHSLQAVGILLILKAFSSGCSALTGVEAIANGVPLFREPRQKRAKQTELLLGVLLGALLLGLAIIITHDHIPPRSHDTVLSQVMALAVGRSWFYYVVSVAITLVLMLAANTSFGGLPVLGSLLARHNYLPHLFALRGDRLVFSKGIWVLAGCAAILLVVVEGNTDSLIPMYAIGVFTGFTIAQTGMVVHWARLRPPKWWGKAILNAVGAVFTAVATIVFVAFKFLDGAWVVVITIPLIIVGFLSIRRYYDSVGVQLGLGGVIPTPHAIPDFECLVLVDSISKLSELALSRALSFGMPVTALTVAYADDPKVTDMPDAWRKWNPGVPLVLLKTQYHSVVRPVLHYVRGRERHGANVLILIPEIEPRRLRHRLLHNQMGFVLMTSLRYLTKATVAIVPFPLKGE